MTHSFPSVFRVVCSLFAFLHSAFLSPSFYCFGTTKPSSQQKKMHLQLLLVSALGASAVIIPKSDGDFEIRKRQFAQAAMMRFECSQLVIERVDPLVQPGMTPSTHLHQIAGGNSFNASMTPVSYDPSKQSTCTSCTFSEDFSNYWTANLYFKARNGTFKRVPQMTNLGLKGKNGGLTVYYIPPYDGKTKVTAFKPVCSSQCSNSLIRSHTFSHTSLPLSCFLFLALVYLAALRNMKKKEKD
jgi:hypothetical protein